VFVLDTNQKGNIAEQAIVLAAIKHGVPVFRPVGEHERCDLILDVGGGLRRVQCKWGHLSPDRAVIKVNLSGNRLTPTGYVVSRYSADEIDLFAVYCGEVDRCFLIPAAICCGRRAIWLRLAPTRNQQKSCINLADDFDFVGAIAQLGERRAGSAKVAGSSPASSTSSSVDDGAINVSSNRLRDQFGHWMDRAADGQEIVITRRGKARVRMIAATAALPPPAPHTPRIPP
jgi:hypothetical protein